MQAVKFAAVSANFASSSSLFVDRTPLRVRGKLDKVSSLKAPLLFFKEGLRVVDLQCQLLNLKQIFRGEKSCPSRKSLKSCSDKLIALQRNDNGAFVGVIAVFAEVNALPGA